MKLRRFDFRIQHSIQFNDNALAQFVTTNGLAGDGIRTRNYGGSF